MKSFQNKITEHRSLQSRKCIHGRKSIQYIKNCTNSKPDEFFVRDARQNTNMSQSKSKKDDMHSKMIKSLIATNQQYFQNKLQISNDGKPSKLKLKIPSNTGVTIYKRDYLKSQSIPNKANKFPECYKTAGDFFDGTTYRNQFTGSQNSETIQKKKAQEHICIEAPTFHQSQYKHNFLNWGASSSMPSMKPHPNPAVTNLPSHNSTVYSSQYTNKLRCGKKQNFKPNCSGILSNGKSNLCQSVTPLLYLTTNKIFFDHKNTVKQNNLKLKTNTLTLTGNQFKGKTEYQSQFIKTASHKRAAQPYKRPLEQLQNLILQL